MSGPAGQPNLLIFRIGSIGDTVVALPCFHAIARRFPHYRRVLLTNAVDSARASSVEAVLEGMGLIHEAVYFPVGHGKLRYSVGLARELRRLKANELVYLAPRPTGLPVYRDLLFFRAVGIRTILGAPLTARVRECRVDPATGELEYEAVRLARSLGPEIPVDLSAHNWDLQLSAAEHAVAAERLSPLPEWRPIIALAPGAKIQRKDWGEANWATLAELLWQRAPDASLVMVGAQDERSLTERLAAHWPGTCVNVCGELTPRESAALLRRCDLLVCHDSGPMHLAASQDTPCVALFGTFNQPRQWFPYGDRHRVIHEAHGVDAIRPDHVADVVQSLLDELRVREPRRASAAYRPVA